MRTISASEALLVAGADGETSGFCESVGDITGAMGGAAAGAMLSGGGVSAAGGAAIGYEVGEAAGEALCMSTTSTITEGANLISALASTPWSAFFAYAQHGPVDWNQSFLEIDASGT